ncbi:MAG: GNAT family N-acetyltransferase [Candidatus Eisenbacteria bacterium]
MELTLIEDWSAEAWDEAVAHYEAAYFCHHSAWFRFLEETQSAIPFRFRIVDRKETAGYFAGLLVKKGPMKILGSPLSGWLTEYMGPVADREFDIQEFLGAMDRMCRHYGIHQIEMGSPMLGQEVMENAGYTTMEWMTFRIPLSADEPSLWNGLKSKARNRIRKARAHGLVVEDCGDPAFADEHHDMLLDVYAKQKSAPPHSREFFRSLQRNLEPQDLLYCLRVRQGERTIASGFFPHDRRRVYSLSTASRREDQPLCPNEILHWTVMSLAGRAGIGEYSLGDNYRVPVHGGRFKDKFNGHPMPVHRYVKSYSLLAKYGRGAYKKLVYAGRSLKDAFRQ